MTALRRSHTSSGNIPFLWEHLPGISKVTHDQTNKISSPSKTSLPPPPCSSSRPLARRSIYVPLPPCPFVPTQELSLIKKGMKKMDDHDDPFLAALKECTRCNQREKRKSVKEKVTEMKIFSCKYDIGVRKDVLIRVHDGKKFMEVKGE
ncbi:hypothetical protein IEQ34_011463 [Dendrobium chrysotoxum]|uniref:Uncharacterized protein n=1 Tax=Dendrobium chrysotoxum TaxID=161865 RepID=A0AAV7GSD1_DENCH|nr:hypothetical protein IEQ34_011463 [Dendrobium chrysotoxum]